MNKILLFTFFLIFQITSSQEFNLNKSWVMNSAVDCSGKKLKRSQENHWNVIFKTNGFATFIISKDLKKEAPFKVNGDEINLANVNYKISKITKDSLILLENSKRCIKYLFLTKSATQQIKAEIIKKQAYKHFMHNGDTVYFTTEYNAPKLKNYESYHSYFYKKLPYFNKPDCVAQFQFIVSKNGEILNPKGSISCLKNDQKKVFKIIKKMKGNWTPMLIDGKPVNSLIREKITYGKTMKLSTH